MSIRTQFRTIHKVISLLVFLSAIGYFFYAKTPAPPSPPAVVQAHASSTSVATSSATSSEPWLKPPIKSADCVTNGPYPDVGCTPGAIMANVSTTQICVSGYSSTVRNVTAATKDAVFREYHVTKIVGEYEVDHFISLELGGSNDIANLWPEPATPTPGFHEKDKVENELHKKVCDGTMTLAIAQRIIATDWLGEYKRMTGQP